jgi:hypothetical protein
MDVNRYFTTEQKKKKESFHLHIGFN